MDGGAPTSEQIAAQIDRVHELVCAGAAIGSAARLGVLGRLAAGPVDAAGLAADCGLSLRGAQALLGALAGIGLAEGDGHGLYHAALPCLDVLATALAPWEAMDEVLRSGVPVAAGDTPEGAARFYPGVATLLSHWYTAAAERFAALLHHSGQTVLDAGAGAAPWSLALARRDPGSRVTALDLPGPIALARAAVHDAGREAQFSYRAADLFSAELEPAGFDLVILANVCHLFDAARVGLLLGRLRAALRPGGSIAIVDELPDENSAGPGRTLLYALGLLLRTAGGALHPFSTYASLLLEAGFTAIERVELAERPLISLVSART